MNRLALVIAFLLMVTGNVRAEFITTDTAATREASGILGRATASGLMGAGFLIGALKVASDRGVVKAPSVFLLVGGVVLTCHTLRLTLTAREKMRGVVVSYKF